MKKTMKIINYVLIFIAIICTVLSSKKVKAYELYEKNIINIEIKNDEKNIFQFISLKNIEINIYESKLSYEKNGEKVFSETYYATIYTNKNGKANFVAPSDEYSVYINLQTLPKGFGIDEYNKFCNIFEKNISFTLSKVDEVKINELEQVEIFNKKNKKIFANYSKSNSCLNDSYGVLDFIKINIMDCLEYVETIEIYGKKYIFNNKLDLSEKTFHEKIYVLEKLKIIDEKDNKKIYEEFLEYNESNMLENIVYNDEVAINNASNSYISSNFIVYYDNTMSISIASYVSGFFESIRNYFIVEKNFQEPSSSNSTKYCIYLVNDINSNGSTKYSNGYSSIKINYDYANEVISDEDSDNSELECTCAHEYFHAISFTYYSGGNNFLWFNEGIAEWGGLNYLNKSIDCHQYYANKLLSTPETRFDYYNNNSSSSKYIGRYYSTFILFLYIDENMGGVNTIKYILEKAGNNLSDPFAAIDAGLKQYNSTYSIESALFGMYLYNAYPTKMYNILKKNDSVSWDDSASFLLETIGTESSAINDNSLVPLSANYYTFHQEDSTDKKQYQMTITIITDDIENLKVGDISYGDSALSCGIIPINTNRTVYQLISYNEKKYSQELKLALVNTNNSVSCDYQLLYAIQEVFDPSANYEIQNVGSDKFLTAIGTIQTNVNLAQYSQLDSNRQKFEFTESSLNSYTYNINSLAFSNLYMSVTNASSIVTGTNVEMNGLAKKWYLIHKGNGVFQIVYYDEWLFLTSNGNENGSYNGIASTSDGNVYLSTDLNNDYQKWKLIKK